MDRECSCWASQQKNSGHRIITSLKVFKCRNGNVVTNEPDRKLVRIKFELAQITRTGWFQTVWNICESKSSKMLKWSNQFQHVPISGQNRRSMPFLTLKFEDSSMKLRTSKGFLGVKSFLQTLCKILLRNGVSGTSKTLSHESRLVI